jgi:hypothetical protein
MPGLTYSFWIMEKHCTVSIDRFLRGMIATAFGLAATLACAAQAPDPHSVPFVDGKTGPCSVEFTVKDASGSPLYNAQIHVHFSYGFWGVHKMDLQVGTNIDGKARINGLPSKAKIPLYFQAIQGNKEADFSYDPAVNCKAETTMVVKEH